MFACKMYGPGMSRASCEKRVNEVVASLDLESCQDIKVGQGGRLRAVLILSVSRFITPPIQRSSGKQISMELAYVQKVLSSVEFPAFSQDLNARNPLVEPPAEPPKRRRPFFLCHLVLIWLVLRSRTSPEGWQHLPERRLGRPEEAHVYRDGARGASQDPLSRCVCAAPAAPS